MRLTPYSPILGVHVDLCSESIRPNWEDLDFVQTNSEGSCKMLCIKYYVIHLISWAFSISV